MLSEQPCLPTPRVLQMCLTNEGSTYVLQHFICMQYPGVFYIQQGTCCILIQQRFDPEWARCCSTEHAVTCTYSVAAGIGPFTRSAELINGRSVYVSFSPSFLLAAFAAVDKAELTAYHKLSSYQSKLCVLVLCHVKHASVVVSDMFWHVYSGKLQRLSPWAVSWPNIVMMCRAAMVGYAILAYVEYNQELRRAAAIVYQRLQQQGGIGL